jgi:hypothetical protein
LRALIFDRYFLDFVNVIKPPISWWNEDII